ncbi:MAG: class I SAM-dependent methyltransferase [Calothrix sp. FI2-JRJ7]|jgi:ubiquinone/menaquinone biosynthesis C-methylase UbiE|nr:class I SAM-dependent methyltransferase [Calothrix sp. FI2-JRJ7]
MTVTASDLLEKIRQQFDSAPYPRVPLDKSLKDDANSLYIHNLVTPYYLRNQKVIDTKEKVILDAGCGSGWTSLLLAQANPGTKIIGIDISEESVKLAQQRLLYHGVEDAEFHALSLEDLPKLGMEFDYINCDELLYLFPNPSNALQAMKRVLKPEGIIRSNFHCKFQRQAFFRAQEMFAMMGLMNDNPRELEIEIAVETIRALRDNVPLKVLTWNSSFDGEDQEEHVLMNYLFQGDKGYSIREMFAAIQNAGLEFIKMVNWLQWELVNLFKEPDNLPAFLAMSLPELSEEDRLYLFELLNPKHRLLDFWCGHPDVTPTLAPLDEWTNDDWQNAKVHLHPQLRTPNFRQSLINAVTEMKPFVISEFLSLDRSYTTIDSSKLLCIVPLLEQPQVMNTLVERWRQLRPVDPVTLKTTEYKDVFEALQRFITGLESLGYVMVER